MFAPDPPKGCPAAINCKEDINDYVNWMFKIAGVAYHWDEMASSYVDAAGCQLWTAQECRHIDNLTEQAQTLDGSYFELACIQTQKEMLGIEIKEHGGLNHE